MAEPVLLITGTSSGIGLSTAVAAAGAGYRTVATLRNPDSRGALTAAAEMAGVALDVRTLDVTDAGSIEACIDGVVAEHGSLDVLVNNAGAGYVGTIENVSMDDMRRVMETNYFSVVAMTKAAMPHLRTVGGRIVTVSSVGGAVGQPFNEAYCGAKFAVEGFLESLAPVAATVGVHVSIVEPGPVTTEFVNNVGVDISAMFAAAGPYLPAMQAYLNRVVAQFGSDTAQTADEVAAVILAVLRAEHPALRVQTGPLVEEFVRMKLSDLDGSTVLAETGTWVA
jgi:NAD(P)-dependent dehydrogenase (short-subunit alcohol dehydrogenase family)